MKSLRTLLLLAVFCVASAASSSLPAEAVATRAVRIPDYYYVFDANISDVVMKPATLSINNNDALLALKWSKWGQKTATATGLYGLVVCTPDCAHGHYKKIPAQVRASSPLSCPNHPQIFVYGRISIVVPAKPSLNWTLSPNVQTVCAAVATR
jgi:hypothetical protein